MKYDLIVAGVGGQGIISIAAVLGRAAMDAGLRIKQSEIHGMAQRGGSVYSHLRISDREIYSDVIPSGSADMILSVEPMEALRYLAFLSSEGILISNEVPFQNISNYPDVDAIHQEIRKLERHLLFDADRLAKENGSPRSMNMAMLGAASPFIDIPQEGFEEAMKARFASKGERIVDVNLKVFRAARDLAGEAAPA